MKRERRTYTQPSRIETPLHRFTYAGALKGNNYCYVERNLPVTNRGILKTRLAAAERKHFKIMPKRQPHY